jgi:hypothetical protein
MAKKDDQDISGRVLSKVIGGCSAATDGAGVTTILGAEGWKSTTVNAGALTLIYNIQSWDLSGYTMQDMTLFPQGVLFQDMSSLPIEITGVPSLTRATIVSTTPLNEAALTIFDNGHWRLPGSLSSTFNLDNILQARVQGFLALTTFAGLQQTKEASYGSGDSTAGEKIWMCDAYLYPTIALQTLNTPDMAIIMPALIAEEPELEYMMRLSRSLEPIY